MVAGNLYGHCDGCHIAAVADVSALAARAVWDCAAGATQHTHLPRFQTRGAHNWRRVPWRYQLNAHRTGRILRADGEIDAVLFVALDFEYRLFHEFDFLREDAC